MNRVLYNQKEIFFNSDYKKCVHFSLLYVIQDYIFNNSTQNLYIFSIEGSSKKYEIHVDRQHLYDFCTYLIKEHLFINNKTYIHRREKSEKIDGIYIGDIDHCIQNDIIPFIKEETFLFVDENFLMDLCFDLLNSFIEHGIYTYN